MGNLLSRTVDGATTTMTCNAADQLTSVDGVTVAYDGDGNLSGTGAGDAIGYDDAGRAVSLDVGGSGPLSAVYRGDDQVERASLGGTTAITSLLGVTAEISGRRTTGYTRLPGGAVHAVRSPGGAVHSVRSPGGAVDSVRSPGGAVHYVVADRLGSTVALVDDAGVVTTRYAYTPYGQTSVEALTGGHIDQPWRFTGQRQDPTGLYKMGLRYYHPEQARWTQPDPALPLDRLPFANTYLYVGGNPTNCDRSNRSGRRCTSRPGRCIGSARRHRCSGHLTCSRWSGRGYRPLDYYRDRCHWCRLLLL